MSTMMSVERPSPLLRLVVLGAGLVIIAAGMKAAASVVNLVLLSLLLAATLSPVPVMLTKRGLGRGAAIGLTVLLSILGGAALVFVLARSVSRLSDNLPVYQASLSGLVDGVTQKLAARGIEVNSALKPNPAKIMGIVGGLAGAALNLVGVALFALVLIALFLIELPLFKSDDSRPGSLRSRLDSAMTLVRRFVGLNGLFGAVIAVVDLIIMWSVGTDAAVLWAVIAFLFAFVPFGFILSAIPPFLLTLLEFGVGRAFLMFGLFFVVNFIGDNVVKPKLMGSGLGLSPLVIVLALLGWGVVLGPMGALLAIPLTLTVKELLPIFIGERAAPAPPAVQAVDVPVGMTGLSASSADPRSMYVDRQARPHVQHPAVTISVAPPARATATAASALSPIDRVSGVIFGLIMALTFTGTLSVATADRNEVREMLIGALGCNIAWGLVDAVMYLLATLTERRRNLAILREVRRRPGEDRAHQLIADALPPVIASTMEPAELDVIRTRLERLPEPAPASLSLGDFRAALGVFLLIFLATLPVALPFAVISDAHRALRISNGIALVMLFAGGYYLGRHAEAHPLRTGVLTLAAGVLLVWATIALGG